jgi:Fic family protein
MLFETPILTAPEQTVLSKIEALRRTLQYAVGQPRLRWTGLLRRSTFARNIQGSNSIEGINVSIEDAIAAVEGEELLDADSETRAAVTGYRNAMTYVLQLAADPHFSHGVELIRSLHFMIMSYDLSKNPGRWRPGAIYVRNDAKGDIVYEGPAADELPALMDELVGQLRSPDSTPCIVRAAMGHLNLVMIHPFSDGNGRMGRALQTMILAREGILTPEFSSVEEYLGRNTDDYYQVLGEVGAGSWHPTRDARPWVRFMLTAHFRQASTLLRRLREMERLWDALEKEVARRSLPERTLVGLADAASGLRVRNSTYRVASDVSENLASRDLKALVEAKLLVPKGEKRGRYYIAADTLKTLRMKCREPRGIPDPFGEGPTSSSGRRPPSSQSQSVAAPKPSRRATSRP